MRRARGSSLRRGPGRERRERLAAAVAVVLGTLGRPSGGAAGREGSRPRAPTGRSDPWQCAAASRRAFRRGAAAATSSRRTGSPWPTAGVTAIAQDTKTAAPRGHSLFPAPPPTVATRPLCNHCHRRRCRRHSRRGRQVRPCHRPCRVRGVHVPALPHPGPQGASIQDRTRTQRRRPPQWRPPQWRRRWGRASCGRRGTAVGGGGGYVAGGGGQSVGAPPRAAPPPVPFWAPPPPPPPPNGVPAGPPR